MTRSRVRFLTILMFFLAVLVSGCGSSSSNSSGPDTGILNLGLTDASVDAASNVVVEFTGITIKPSSGDILDFDFNVPRQIDLLSLNGGGSEIILNGVTVPAGHYDWIRLKVNADCDVLDSYIEINSVQTSLWIPSGAQTGLKLVSGFVVAAGGEANYTIDFDLRKSVNYPQGMGNCSGNYRLKPALRLVDNIQTGSISGTVDPALISNGSCTSGNAVYVFEGWDVTPDDIDELSPNPVTSAMVSFDDASQEYVYKAAFLEAGNYTVSFTCQAGDDDPEVDESVTPDPIAFVGTSNVTVSSGTETIHNFL